jgi:hypothetical protein
VRDWLPILLTPVVSLAIAWLGYRQATRAKQADVTASPYGELAHRVVELEKADEEKSKRIDRLEVMLTDAKRTNRPCRTTWLRSCTTSRSSAMTCAPAARRRRSRPAFGT